MTETQLLAELVGVFQVYGLQSTVALEETKNARFLCLQEGLECGNVGQILGGWASLGLHVLDDSGCGNKYVLEINFTDISDDYCTV